MAPGVKAPGMIACWPYRVPCGRRSGAESPGHPPAHEGVMPFSFGLDLAQTHDPSAAVILDASGEGEQRIYACRYLEQFRLGTSYPTIVSTVGDLLRREPLRGQTALAIDYTSVGHPVFEMFTGVTGVYPIGVTVTGGVGWSINPNHFRQWQISKIQLVGTVQKFLQSGRLTIGATLPHAATLQRELQEFKVKTSKAAHEVYDTREGPHEDLVLSLAIALFVAERQPRAKAIKVSGV